MKKNIKLVIGFIIGIIFCTTTVYAINTIISANEVGYIDNTSIGAVNVQDAIDKLYDEAKNNCPDNYICTYKNGVEVSQKNSNIIAAYTYHQTKCPTGEESTCQETSCINYKNIGSCGPGTIIKYKVNNSEIKYFNVLHDDGDKMTVQQNMDTVWAAWNANNNYWGGPTTALASLDSATSTWTNVEEQTYTMGTTSFGNLGAYTLCNAYNNCTANAYTFSERTTKARMIMLQEAVALGCQDSNNRGYCPPWLVSNSNYHTMNTSSVGSWRVFSYNGVTYTYGSYSSAIRAVIVISK